MMTWFQKGKENAVNFLKFYDTHTQSLDGKPSMASPLAPDMKKL